MNPISCREFRKGIREFRKREARDAMYKVASFLVSEFWGDVAKMANGLGVLLLTWNQAFYRYGRFNFDKLEDFLGKHFKKIESFRKRDISSLDDSDKSEIEILFKNIMSALQIDSGKLRGRKSPVAAAKALHLLVPEFFPLWDNRIAKGYNCRWKNSDNATLQYIKFCKKIQEIEKQVKNFVKDADASTLKLIDEYNYAKYTQDWI